MCRVRGYISSLMISMDGHVQTHQLFETLILVTHHVGEVTGPVEQSIGLYMITRFVFAAVDISCDTRQPGYKVHTVVEDSFPIIFLVHARRVFLGELAFCL